MPFKARNDNHGWLSSVREPTFTYEYNYNLNDKMILRPSAPS